MYPCRNMKNEDESELELVQQTFRLPKQLIRRLKVYAAVHDTTQQAVTIEALEDWLKRHEKRV